MKLRVEPFVQGFFTSIKPQMDPIDRDLFALIFQGQAPFAHSHPDERNAAKPAHYFRFKRSHLNVLLPVWMLNGKSTSGTDRFRIALTPDHSVILDTKESIVYDPTTEMAHAIPTYRPFLASFDWKHEVSRFLREELAAQTLIVSTFSQRIETLPLVYEAFSALVKKRGLKARVPDFRAGLDLSEAKRRASTDEEKERALIDLVMDELSRRAVSRLA